MSNIFETFQGADLDRFVKCVLAVRDADLAIGTQTQAGINRISGYVWMWDEDWSGSVACSRTLEVSWFYACPNCGEEHQFKCYADVAHYGAKWVGECDACSTNEEVEE